MFQTQTETTKAITAGGKTGEFCKVSGPYKSSTTPTVTVFVKKGEKFPPAPSSSASGQVATWTLVKE